LQQDKAEFDRAFDLAVPSAFWFTDVYDSLWMQRHQSKPPLPGLLGVYAAPRSSKDTGFLRLSDAEVVSRVGADLERIFPGVMARSKVLQITRFPYAYPVFEPGAYRRTRDLSAATTGTLQLAGDYLSYPTFEAAAESGALAAARIRKALGR
jgi:protoporphyrinogen oxidase